MRRLFKIYLDKPELAGVVLLVVLTLVFEMTSAGVFLSYENVRGVLGLLPEMGLVAVGVTILMIAGEFDISVGSVFALAPMVMATSMVHGLAFFPAVALGLVAAGGIGLLNGFITLRFSIPSFITTLGMLFVARSITVVISGGFPPVLPMDTPDDTSRRFRTDPAVDVLVRGNRRGSDGDVVFHKFWQLDQSDRRANRRRRRARYSRRRREDGLFRTLRGPSRLCRHHSGAASRVATAIAWRELELQAVAAAVIGGTSLYGGVGTVLGAIVGALLIRVIDNGLVLSHVDANWFKFAIGSLLILAVVGNSWLRRTSRGIKLET